MRKIVSIACTVVLLLSFSACGTMKGEVKMPESYEEFAAAAGDVTAVSTIEEWDAATNALAEKATLGVVVSDYEHEFAVNDADFIKRCKEYFCEYDFGISYKEASNEKGTEYFFFLEDEVVSFKISNVVLGSSLGNGEILMYGTPEQEAQRDYILGYADFGEELKPNFFELPKSSVEFSRAKKYASNIETGAEWDEMIEKLNGEKMAGFVYSQKIKSEEPLVEAQYKDYAVSNEEVIKSAIELLKSCKLERVTHKACKYEESDDRLYVFIGGEIVIIPLMSGLVYSNSDACLEITNFEAVKEKMNTVQDEFISVKELV